MSLSVAVRQTCPYVVVLVGLGSLLILCGFAVAMVPSLPALVRLYLFVSSVRLDAWADSLSPLLLFRWVFDSCRYGSGANVM